MIYQIMNARIMCYRSQYQDYHHPKSYGLRQTPDNDYDAYIRAPLYPLLPLLSAVFGGVLRDTSNEKYQLWILEHLLP
jgi:hypothetical protein